MHSSKEGGLDLTALNRDLIDAETLRRWRETFVAAADRVDALGFDETFRRMWTLYLAYSEAGFRAGYLDVGQFLLRR